MGEYMGNIFFIRYNMVKKNKKKLTDSKKSPTLKFSKYIHRVLKSVAPEKKLTGQVCQNIQSILYDLYERTYTVAMSLARNNIKKKTIGQFEIQTSIRLLYPGEISKHAVFQGIHAINSFYKSY